MKKETREQRSDIVNDILHYIYSYIDTDLNVAELSSMKQISAHHLHRIFKEETGNNIYETIRSIRLQKAANLLLTNRYASISEIASMCGYSSQTSFIKAFKSRFETPPGDWRRGAYLAFSQKILSSSPSASSSDSDFTGLIPKIVKTEPVKVAYIRHKGYNISIKNTWNRLYAWCIENRIEKENRQIALHHDNPAITPLQECAYVAAVELPKGISPPHGQIGYLEIPGSLCAVFDIKGRYGDVLRFMRYVYHIWLPNSGFETKTQPPYAVYKKNHFLNESGEFELEFFLPIRIL
ncbi:GyrI-like domain-containing protein [Sulfurimonas sp. HSL-1716]|uniref:AraC family transcriptional regulator n=1 Tax=Hydrocurvibacter sulfurireducens TaxID=3131937 RepID=UPI0031F75B0E